MNVRQFVRYDLRVTVCVVILRQLMKMTMVLVVVMG